MRFSEFCIKRPVFTIVLSLIIIVVGLIGFLRIPVRSFPNIDFPVIIITTDYTGASANIIESQVTTPIENDIIGASGIDTMRSQSSQGESRIILQYQEGVNIDAAANDIRNLLSGISKQLPKDCEAPIIEKRNPDNIQTLILTVTDPKLSSMELTDYANRYVLPQLEEVMGVAMVELYNERDFAMKINLDPLKMAADHVTVNDLTSILETQNQNVSSGVIKSPSRYYSVLSQGQLNTVKDFQNLIIRNQNGYLLRFGDISSINIGPDNIDNAMRVDGKETIGIGVYSQDSFNPIEVAKNVRYAITKLQKTLPSEMQIQAVWDSTNYLKEGLKSVYRDLTIAVLLVTLVVIVFLGSVRSMFIPILTIPICLTGIFAFMYFMGYSINVFTLLALVLAIGLVVDDAIVMLENIYRHVEEGVSVFQAAIKGSHEILFAIIAMTLTLAAVYAPVGFATGITGIIFRQFAFTLALAVIISGFVALTLSPMMCARLLVLPKSDHGIMSKYHFWLDNTFFKLMAYYRKLLKWFLQNRKWVVLFLIIIGLLGYICFKHLGFELEPQENTGTVLVNMDPEPNASFAFLNSQAKQIESMLQSLKGVSHVQMMVDPDDGIFAIITLLQNFNTAKDAQNLISEISQKGKTIPGINLNAFNMSELGGSGKYGNGVRLIIASDDSYAQLNKTAQEYLHAIKSFPGISNASQDLQMDDKQYVVHINRDLAATLNVSMDDINNTLKTMLGGSDVTMFDWNDFDYNVTLQLPQEQLQDWHMLNELYVRSSSGQMVPLSTLVSVQSEITPQELPHEGRLRAVTLSAQLNSGYALGQVVDYLTQTAKNTLPSGYQIQFQGAAKRMLESKYTMLGSFILAIIFIYLVLAAQFESFIDPFIIMLCVPLSVFGAVFTLKLAGETISIYAEIGFITLVGLIAKHGILITEFANQMRERGSELTDAIIEAAALRLRPILMTTAAMTLGALPLALSSGAGSLSRQQIGWVLVGGLLFGTFFSLIVVPIAYSFFGKFRKIKSIPEQKFECAPHPDTFADSSN